jgi:hypothetical protein
MTKSHILTAASHLSHPGERPVCHIRLPQRSDKVEGKESDIASVSNDTRTATQDPTARQY